MSASPLPRLRGSLVSYGDVAHHRHAPAAHPAPLVPHRDREPLPVSPATMPPMTVTRPAQRRPGSRHRLSVFHSTTDDARRPHNVGVKDEHRRAGADAGGPSSPNQYAEVEDSRAIHTTSSPHAPATAASVDAADIADAATLARLQDEMLHITAEDLLRRERVDRKLRARNEELLCAKTARHRRQSRTRTSPSPPPPPTSDSPPSSPLSASSAITSASTSSLTSTPVPMSAPLLTLPSSPALHDSDALRHISQLETQIQLLMQRLEDANYFIRECVSERDRLRADNYSLRKRLAQHARHVYPSYPVPPQLHAEAPPQPVPVLPAYQRHRHQQSSSFSSSQSYSQPYSHPHSHSQSPRAAPSCNYLCPPRFSSSQRSVLSDHEGNDTLLAAASSSEHGFYATPAASSASPQEMAYTQTQQQPSPQRRPSDGTITPPRQTPTSARLPTITAEACSDEVSGGSRGGTRTRGKDGNDSDASSSSSPSGDDEDRTIMAERPGVYSPSLRTSAMRAYPHSQPLPTATEARRLWSRTRRASDDPAPEKRREYHQTTLHDYSRVVKPGVVGRRGMKRVGLHP